MLLGGFALLLSISEVSGYSDQPMNLAEPFAILRMSAKLKCLRSATKNLIFLPLLVSAESRPNQTVRSRPEVSAKSFLKGPEVLWCWWPPEEHFYGRSKATSFRLRLNTGDRPRWSIIALHICFCHFLTDLISFRISEESSPETCGILWIFQ